MMNWVYFVTAMSCVIIRIPHKKVSKQTKITRSQRDLLEKSMLAIVVCSCAILPLLYLFTPFLNLANQTRSNISGGLGTLLALVGLWIFYLSHRDLGRQWSLSLEIRESHQLITKGIYQKIRHPMYSSLFLMALSQWLLISNWLVAPAYFLTYSLLYVMRI